jgi:hypothetical protein
MTKVYVAAGHSQNTDIPQRLYEWERCMRAEEECVRLLRDSGLEVVVPEAAMRTMANNEALRAKVQQCNAGGLRSGSGAAPQCGGRLVCYEYLLG